LRAAPGPARPLVQRHRRNGNGHGPSPGLSRRAREELLEAAEDLSLIAEAIQQRNLSTEAVKRCAVELHRALKLLQQLAGSIAAA
ncbi:MAG: hypothetical protein N3I86_16335, partial [Verrucomicrobiae bacterium]|nr:hypothetical protein [Verrucomicrobiae bacterium]